MKSFSAADRKGIVWFLLFTFIPTYLVEFIMYFRGYSFVGVPPVGGQFIVAGIMFFPGIAAFVVRKFITREGFKDHGMMWGGFRYYLQIYLLVPALFLCIYGLTWLFVQSPDFSLQTFIRQYGLPGLPVSAPLAIAMVFLSTVTMAPFLNSTAGFGEEYGWRGYLLPKLLVLGNLKALVISGAIWGLWHMPLILMGYKYGAHVLPGILFFTALLMFLGIYIGYLRLKSGSTIVAAFAHGTFNAQAYGVWTLLFPDIHPLLGGLTGITGIVVFAALSLLIIRHPGFSTKTKRRERQRIR